MSDDLSAGGMYTRGSTSALGAAAAVSRGMCATARPYLMLQYLQQHRTPRQRSVQVWRMHHEAVLSVCPRKLKP